jgi:hypothetical protein
MQLCKETMINFAPAQNIAGFPRHAAGMIFAHPHQIMRIVSASFKAPGVPRPKALALRAKHLITPLRFMHKNLAIGARFRISLENSDRRDGIRIANMQRVVAFTRGFPAVGASVLVASCALPSGRHEAVAICVSATMNELLVRLFMLVKGEIRLTH